jgi:hypothetical protein
VCAAKEKYEVDLDNTDERAFIIISFCLFLHMTARQ